MNYFTYRVKYATLELFENKYLKHILVKLFVNSDQSFARVWLERC